MHGAPQDIFVRDDATTLLGLEGSHGVMTRLENALGGMGSAMSTAQSRLEAAQRDKAIAEANLGQPFARADELDKACTRVEQLNDLLASTNQDRPTNDEEVSDSEPVAQEPENVGEREQARDSDEIVNEVRAKIRSRRDSQEQKQNTGAPPTVAMSSLIVSMREDHTCDGESNGLTARATMPCGWSMRWLPAWRVASIEQARQVCG